MQIFSFYILTLAIFANNIAPGINAGDSGRKNEIFFCGWNKCDTYCSGHDLDLRYGRTPQCQEKSISHENEVCSSLELGQEAIEHVKYMYNSETHTKDVPLVYVCCKPKEAYGYCTGMAVRCGKTRCKGQPDEHFCHQYSSEKEPVCISERKEREIGEPTKPYDPKQGHLWYMKEHNPKDVKTLKKVCSNLPDGGLYHFNDEEWCCRPNKGENCRKLQCGLSVCDSTDPPYCVGEGSSIYSKPYQGTNCALEPIKECEELKAGQTFQYQKGRWCTRPREEDLGKRIFISKAHAFCNGAPCQMGVTHCIKIGTSTSRCAEKDHEKFKCKGIKVERLVLTESGIPVTCCITGECFHYEALCGGKSCQQSGHNQFCGQFRFGEAFCPAIDSGDVEQCRSLETGEEYLMQYVYHHRTESLEPLWCCRSRLDQLLSYEQASCPRRAVWCGNSGCKKSYCVRINDTTTCPEDEPYLVEAKCSRAHIELKIAPNKWCCRPTAKPFSCPGISSVTELPPTVGIPHYCGRHHCQTYCKAKKNNPRGTVECANPAELLGCHTLDLGQEMLIDKETVCCKPKEHHGHCWGKAVKCGDTLCKAEPGLQFCSQYTSENKPVCMGAGSQENRSIPLQPPHEGFQDHHNTYIGSPYRFCAGLSDGEEYHMKTDEWCCRPTYNSSGSTTCQKKSLLCAYAICKANDMPYCIEKDWSDLGGTEMYCASKPILKCNDLKEGEELQYTKLEWCYKPTKQQATKKVLAPLKAAWCGNPCAVGVDHCIRKEGAKSKCAETEEEKHICKGAKWGQFVKYVNGTRMTCCQTSECSHQLVHRCGSEKCLESAFCVDPFNGKPKCSSYFEYPGWDSLPEDCDYLGKGEEFRMSKTQWCCRPTFEKEAEVSTATACPQQAAWCNNTGCMNSFCIRNQNGETTCPPGDDIAMNAICSNTPYEQLLIKDLWCCKPTAEPWTCPGNAMNLTLEYMPFNSTFNETGNSSQPKGPIPMTMLGCLVALLFKRFVRKPFH